MLTWTALAFMATWSSPGSAPHTRTTDFFVFVFVFFFVSFSLLLLLLLRWWWSL